MSKIELGQKVRDTITGFEGTTVGYSVFLNGCVRWDVQPGVDKDGKLLDDHWFDEMNLEVVEAPAVKTGPRDTGGPMPSIPTRHADPTR